jgi:hypothetical protein
MPSHDLLLYPLTLLKAHEQPRKPLKTYGDLINLASEMAAAFQKPPSARLKFGNNNFASQMSGNSDVEPTIPSTLGFH